MHDIAVAELGERSKGIASLMHSPVDDEFTTWTHVSASRRFEITCHTFTDAVAIQVYPSLGGD